MLLNTKFIVAKRSSQSMSLVYILGIWNIILYFFIFLCFRVESLNLWL